MRAVKLCPPFASAPARSSLSSTAAFPFAAAQASAVCPLASTTSSISVADRCGSSRSSSSSLFTSSQLAPLHRKWSGVRPLESLSKGAMARIWLRSVSNSSLTICRSPRPQAASSLVATGHLCSTIALASFISVFEESCLGPGGTIPVYNGICVWVGYTRFWRELLT